VVTAEVAGDAGGPAGGDEPLDLAGPAPAELVALAEALGVATEARTAAVLDGRVPSRRASSGSLATGTGTDCIVVAAPEAGPSLRWVGKHTLAGALLGGAVREAVARGVRRWIAEEVARGVQARVVRA